MRGLLIFGVCLALLAAFMLPTAQASTSYDYDTSSLLETAIVADDSGGSLASHESVAATQQAEHQEQAQRADESQLAVWYPGKFLFGNRRARLRAGGGWYPGKWLFGGRLRARGC